MKTLTVQTKVLLLLTLLLVIALICLTMGAALLNYAQTRTQNAERLTAALGSFQREFERGVARDKHLFYESLTNSFTTTLAFKAMVLIDSTDIQIPAKMIELGTLFNAARLAFYYQVEGQGDLQLRLYYDRALGGTGQISVEGHTPQHRLIQKQADGQITMAALTPPPQTVPLIFPTVPQAMFLALQPDGLMLVADLPYRSAFTEVNYSLRVGEELGRFLLEKPLDLNLPELDNDLGVQFTVYDLQGRRGQGALRMPDLDLAYEARAFDNRQVLKLVDADGETYDAMLRPLMYHDLIVGYVAANIAQARTFQKIGETVRVLALIACGVLLIAFLLMSVVVMRLIAHPLQHITSVTHRQLQGDWAARVELHTLDEYGELGQTFNRLSQQITTLLHEQRLTIANLTQAEEDIRTLNAELEERVRERTAALETANQELQSFAYVVSHDLKAPLRAINRLAQWLVEDYATAFDAKGQEMVDLLVGRVKRMDALIEGVLEYSRVGRVVSEKTRIDLNHLLPEVIDSLSPPPSIQIDIAPGLPTLLGDTTRIQQVFQNLIGNAIKFMDKPQGQISIKAVDAGAYWKFTVSDTGPGIDLNHADRLFQIFQTLRPRDEVENTGVGLAIVKKIVEFYGGKVWVESTVGQGSVFLFTLPKT